MKLPVLSRRVLVAGTLSAGVIAVGAAAAVTGAISGGDSDVGAAQAAETPPPPAATLAVLDARGSGPQSLVPWDKPLRLAVTNGRVVDVEVTQADGSIVAGDVTDGGSRWSSSSTLVPTERYAAHVVFSDLAKKEHEQTLTLTATDAPRLRAVLSPGEGRVVGVGAPVSVSFNRDVPQTDRDAVVARLTVVTDPAVDGAWHWMNAQEVHWRPPSYWKPGTSVTVASQLNGLRLGSVWGAGAAETTFRVGDSHVSKVDIANHVMRVYINGALVRTMPISAGQPKYPTRGGVHITMDKHDMIIMDSATVGIPKGHPDYYYEKIKYAVRITNSGTFTHSAPWSVPSQGRRNVSHGCINLSPANALWFYNLSRWGDIVEVFNTPVGPYSWDAGTRDWNMTWAEWQAGVTTAHNLPWVKGTPFYPPTKPSATPSPTPSPKPSPKPSATASPAATPRATGSPR